MSMRILCGGDSRTFFGGWQPILAVNLNATGMVPACSIRTSALNWGSVAQASTGVAAYLDDASSSLAYPQIFLLQMGEHDMVSGTPNETTFKANYNAILDALRAKWFNVEIYCDFPWMVAGDGANYAATKGYIQDLIAARAYCHAGVDQGVVLKGNDMGATRTSDGIHMNAAGHVAYAAAMQTALGY